MKDQIGWEKGQRYERQYYNGVSIVTEQESRGEGSGEEILEEDRMKGNRRDKRRSKGRGKA